MRMNSKIHNLYQVNVIGKDDKHSISSFLIFQNVMLLGINASNIYYAKYIPIPMIDNKFMKRL